MTSTVFELFWNIFLHFIIILLLSFNWMCTPHYWLIKKEHFNIFSEILFIVNFVCLCYTEQEYVSIIFTSLWSVPMLFRYWWLANKNDIFFCLRMIFASRLVLNLYSFAGWKISGFCVSEIRAVRTDHKRGEKNRKVVVFWNVDNNFALSLRYRVLFWYNITKFVFLD